VKIAITGISAYLPKKVITNDDLAKTLDTSHEWIYTRTGIEKRHVVSEKELASDLGIKAAKGIIEQTNLNPKEIDGIIVSTTTADRRFPSCACKIQGEIGAKNAFALDINAACAGFIYGLAVSDSMMKGLNLNTVLLIGAETLSKFVDWTDRSTCVLFGDGAGAFLLQASTRRNSIIAAKLYSDGKKEKYNHILAHNGPQNDNRGYTTMEGRPVFKQAIDCMASSMNEILKENRMKIDDVDWIVPHQANRRILESLCKIRNFPLEKVIITTQEHANTSSASIPLAIKDGIDTGKIKKGDVILLTALGAGLVWGSAIIRI
jgi:3-oxoacyl-[acyl-carrier-protein] synthase-3